jgi:hypothetical protein
MTENEDDFDAEMWAEVAVGVRDGDGEQRPRGLLSHDDRLFVAGMKDFEWSQSESNARRRVIERVAQGFVDFSLLRWLSQKEGEDVLEELGEDDLHRRVADLVTFVYQATGGDADALSSMIEAGVLHGENTELGKGPAKANAVHPHSGGASSVDVSIQIERNPDVERIYEQFQETGGDDLTPKEIGVLVREGRLDADDLEELQTWGLGLSGPPDPEDMPINPSDAVPDLPDDEN